MCTYPLSLHKVGGHPGMEDVASLEPVAGQGQVGAQSALQPGQEVTAAHVRKQAWPAQSDQGTK